MPSKTRPVIFSTVNALNQNEVAHVFSHLLIGFGAAHFIAWFYWIYVLATLLILSGLKEFFVDAYLYNHAFEDQAFDFLQYFIGFLAYVVWIYFVQATGGNTSLVFPF